MLKNLICAIFRKRPSVIKEFSIVKSRPKVKLTLTRDSVCAGDDFDPPHEKIFSQPSFLDPEAFMSQLSYGYLPSIAGTGHTWDCIHNGIHVGTISVNMITSKIREMQYSDENNVHFRYNSSTY